MRHKTKKIYFDTFFWFDLIRKSIPMYKEIDEILTNLKEEHKLEIAVDLILMEELSYNKSDEEIQEIFGLFNKYNSGILLKDEFRIFKEELKEQLLSIVENRFVNRLDYDVVYESLKDYIIRGINKDMFTEKLRDSISDLLDINKFNFNLLYFNKSKRVNSTKMCIKDELDKRYMNDVPKMDYEEVLNDEENGMISQSCSYIKEIYYYVRSKAIENNLCSSEEYRDIMMENNRLRKAVTNCPTFEIESKLYAKLRLNQDQCKTIKANDFYDVAHLAIAIPYCDFIVIDKKMFQLCENELKFGEKYNTKIYSYGDIEKMINDIKFMT